MEALIAAFNDTAAARDKGVRFNGAVYQCVRADDVAIYAKKVR